MRLQSFPRLREVIAAESDATLAATFRSGVHLALGVHDDPMTSRDVAEYLDTPEPQVLAALQSLYESGQISRQLMPDFKDGGRTAFHFGVINSDLDPEAA